MRTKLNVLLLPKHNGQYDHVRARVILEQTKSKQYTDAKRGAQSPKVTVGAAVSVQALTRGKRRDTVKWSLDCATTDWHELLHPE